MPLVENGQIVQDRYHYVGDDEPVPERVPVIVPAQRFLANTDVLIRRDGFAESIADAVARLQEEYGPALIQRAEVRPEAAPLPDHRILWKPA